MSDFFNGAIEDGEPMTKLSDRIRPGSEAAPWVCREIKKLEGRLSRWAERTGDAEGKLFLANKRIAELKAEEKALEAMRDQYTTEQIEIAFDHIGFGHRWAYDVGCYQEAKTRLDAGEITRCEDCQAALKGEESDE